MTVRLLVHVERVPEKGLAPFVWWAESPDVPGFSAAEDYLPALIKSCRDALAELRPGDDLTFTLDAPPSSTVADVVPASTAETQAESLPLFVSLVA